MTMILNYGRISPLRFLILHRIAIKCNLWR